MRKLILRDSRGEKFFGGVDLFTAVEAAVERIKGAIADDAVRTVDGLVDGSLFDLITIELRAMYRAGRLDGQQRLAQLTEELNKLERDRKEAVNDRNTYKRLLIQHGFLGE